MIIIHGGIESTWGRNFYMGTQNRSNLRFDGRDFDSHHIQLKLWHLEVFPYFYVGKPCICTVEYIGTRVRGVTASRRLQRGIG